MRNRAGRQVARRLVRDRIQSSLAQRSSAASRRADRCDLLRRAPGTAPAHTPVATARASDTPDRIGAVAAHRPPPRRVVCASMLVVPQIRPSRPDIAHATDSDEGSCAAAASAPNSNAAPPETSNATVDLTCERTRTAAELQDNCSSRTVTPSVDLPQVNCACTACAACTRGLHYVHVHVHGPSPGWLRYTVASGC